MVFKKMLQTLGVDGPTVDTVLTDSTCHPGDQLSGEVRLTGAGAPAEIEQIVLSLVTRVERGATSGQQVEFHRTVVSNQFRLDKKEQRTIPFTVRLPWEAPLTEIYGQQLHGMALGLRTELAVAKAVDKGDVDPVSVRPLPSQQRVLDAFEELGFHFKSVELEAGNVHGTRQQLPFFQAIEFYPPAAYSASIQEIELALLNTPHGVEIVLQADKRFGSAVVGRFHVSHEDAGDPTLTTEITKWLDQVAEGARRASPRHNSPYGRQPAHGFHRDQDHRRRHGVGMGGVVAGAAAGMAGGLIAGELLEEMDMFGGDEEDEG